MFSARNPGQKRIDIKQKPYEPTMYRPTMSKKRMPKRSTVCGNKNVEQLILAQLSRDDVCCRDFSASYQSSPQHFTPHSTATSHAIPSRRGSKQNLPEYPLVQYIRWSPPVETTSFEAFQNGRDSKYETCSYCSSAEKCPSNISSSCTVRPRYRTRIMTFSNKCTMTPRLVDVGCGYSSSSTRGSAESVRFDENENAVRDFPVEQSYAARRGPTPILKKFTNWYEDPYYYDESHHGEEYVTSDKVHRIPEPYVDDYHSVTEVDRLLSLDYDGTSCFRKIIYNEGISDEVVKRNRLSSQKDRASTTVGLKYNDESFAQNRSTLFWKEEDSRIPYSHKSSRYHQCCKTPMKESHYKEEPNREEDLLNPGIDRPCLKNPPLIYQVSTIRRPKKVLTSNRNIETYLAVSALNLLKSELQY